MAISRLATFVLPATAKWFTDDIVAPQRWDRLPTLAMVYDKVVGAAAPGHARIRHLMRIAMELGVDAIKIGAPAEIREVPELLDGIAEDVPVFLAGGSRCEPSDVLRLAAVAVRCGAAGLCVGRNVFQQVNPARILADLRAKVDSLYDELHPAPATISAVSSDRRRSGTA